MFDTGWLLDRPERKEDKATIEITGEAQCFGEGALRNARDDARDWREQYEGHLVHELVCAGGIKWLETRDPKALRATHGPQCLLMPGKPSMWANSPQRAHVNDYPWSVEEGEDDKLPGDRIITTLAPCCCSTWEVPVQ